MTELASSIPRWLIFRSVLEFVSWIPSVMDCDLRVKSPFLSEAAFSLVRVFISKPVANPNVPMHNCNMATVCAEFPMSSIKHDRTSRGDLKCREAWGHCACATWWPQLLIWTC